MAYFALVTNIENVHKDENSDRLYLGECFREGVIVGPDMQTGDKVVYLPTDGKLEHWFGDKLSLFRHNEDGSPGGGYIEDNGHIKAIKLRGNQSSGVVIKYDRIVEIFGEQNWNVGDKVSEINGKVFCSKYIPKRQRTPQNGGFKTSYKGRKAEGVTYPEFSMHTDTAQLAYNLDAFKEGDEINMTLKMHGTSQRSMNTFAVMPRGFLRRLFHMPAKTKPAYVLGTRRTVVSSTDGGFYGNDEFRIKHHEKIKPFVEPGMEVFYEVVGYYGKGETDTIMPIGDNTKLKDKAFSKLFGPKTVFSYGCQPGQSEMYVYRITSDNGLVEWTPDQITEWCKKAGVNRVPVIENFVFTTVEDLQDRINKYFEDLVDPIGGHVKEGVVVRIVNRRTFSAYKSKTYEFKVLEGIIKEDADAPDMEEAQDETTEV